MTLQAGLSWTLSETLKTDFNQNEAHIMIAEINISCCSKVIKLAPVFLKGNLPEIYYHL